MKRFLFLISAAFLVAMDTLRGRGYAVNAVMTPHESDDGTESAYCDAAIGFPNAVVKSGSDDRHVVLTSLVGDIPRGVILNDECPADEVGILKKVVALFGIYEGTLPAVAAAAIPVGAEVVVDLATPGRVKALPAGAGTYQVIGRNRFTVAAPGDPVSLIHCVPRAVVVS